MRIIPAELVNIAFLAGFELNVIAQFNLLCGGQLQASKEVRSNISESKGGNHNCYCDE